MNAPLASSRPSLWGFLLALIAPPFLVIASGCLVAWGLELQRLVALDELGEALDRSAIASAKALEERLTEQPQGPLSVAASIGEALTGWEQRPAEELNALYETIEPLGEEPFDHATFQRSFSAFEQYRGLVDRRAPDPQRAAQEKKIIQLIRELGSGLKARDERVAEHTKLQAEMRSLHSSHLLVARDFADFLSLQSAYPADDKSTDDKVLVYTQGVLADLPQVTGLRDGIQTLGDLRTELERLKAKVHAEGPEAGQIFAQKMSEMRTSSGALAASHRDASRKFDAVQAAIQQSDQEMRAARSYLRSAIAALMNDVLRKL